MCWQVRPSAADARTKSAISSEATREQVQAEVNKGKAVNKRHQRYKSKAKEKAPDQEQARTTKEKSKTTNSTAERSSKGGGGGGASGQKAKKKSSDPKKAEKKRGSGTANGRAKSP